MTAGVTRSTTVICHTAIFAISAGVEQTRIDLVKSLFLESPAECEGIIGVNVSENVSQSAYAEGWDLSVQIFFDDRHALQAYLPHPLHQRVNDVTSRGFFDQLVVFDQPFSLEILPTGEKNDNQ